MASAGVLPSFEFNAMYVDSLKQGEPSTVDHFVSYFSPILLRKLRKMLSCTDTIYDVRQETFLRVLTILRSEEGVRSPERFEVLVLGVCNNVVREVYRYKKRMVQIEPEYDIASRAPSPDSSMISGEMGNHVRELLVELGPKARAILQAAFIEEQDRDKICLRFGITRNHLRLLLHRAIKQLEVRAKQQTIVTPAPQMQSPQQAAARRFKAPVRITKVPVMQKPCPVPVFLPGLNAAKATGRQMLAVG
jgi:RNA polymerase sigma-70 factor (ECF subfamily)